MRIIRKQGSSSRHFCHLPGFFSRLFQGLHEGAIVQCECGTRWELQMSGFMDPGLEWVKL